MARPRHLLNKSMILFYRTTSCVLGQVKVKSDLYFGLPLSFKINVYGHCPILDHADYRVTFSSTDMYISISGDTIILTPVPEPENWAMLLAGLGFVGWRLSNQSREKSSLTFA